MMFNTQGLMGAVEMRAMMDAMHELGEACGKKRPGGVFSMFRKFGVKPELGEAKCPKCVDENLSVLPTDRCSMCA